MEELIALFFMLFGILFAVLVFLFWIAIPIMALIAVVVWVWMLVEVAQDNTMEENDKLMWVLIVALTGIVGALVYYFVQRPKVRAAQRAAQFNNHSCS